MNFDSCDEKVVITISTQGRVHFKIISHLFMKFGHLIVLVMTNVFRNCQLVSSFHNIAKIKLEVFMFSGTNIKNN